MWEKISRCHAGHQRPRTICPRIVCLRVMRTRVPGLPTRRGGIMKYQKRLSTQPSVSLTIMQRHPDIHDPTERIVVVHLVCFVYATLGH